MQRLTADRPPSWFEAATGTVLAGAEALLAAESPRQLEESTAVLLGAELHRVLGTEVGLRFDWWFDDVVRAATAAAEAGLGGGPDGAWRAPFRLLHGLAAIAPSALATVVHRALTQLRADVTRAQRASAVTPEPDWLSQVTKIAATGEVWHVRDVYGGRRAVIAGYAYPGDADRSVFLFDFDLCGFDMLVHAGVHDDEAQAAAAWRTLAGPAAHDAALLPVQAADELQSLVYWETGEMHLHGTESRPVMDNWFRAPRRAEDLAQALRRRGIPLPTPRSLYRDVEIDPAIDAFTRWHGERRGVEPDPAAAEALAAEWLEGTVPGAEHVASPHRVEFQLQLIDDWVPDHPVTVGAKALLADWVRWNGERSGLAEPLIEAAVAVAAGGRRAPTDCPAAP